VEAQAKPAVRSPGWKWCCQKLEEMSGLPTVFGNTSESGPGTATRSMCSARISAVSGDIVIERMPAAVLVSLRNHSPD
jgi:hypothetical protein